MGCSISSGCIKYFESVSFCTAHCHGLHSQGVFNLRSFRQKEVRHFLRTTYTVVTLKKSRMSSVILFTIFTSCGFFLSAESPAYRHSLFFPAAGHESLVGNASYH